MCGREEEGRTKDGRTRRERGSRRKHRGARDSKGWRIDRRRSVTRYSCQQAAGVSRASLPSFPPSVSSFPCPPFSRRYGAHQDAGLSPAEYSPRVNAASMFSQRRGALSTRPAFFLSAPALETSAFYFAIFWNTAAVTPSRRH